MIQNKQYGFAQTDIRSDIYALGITLQKLQPKNKKLQKIIKKAIKFDPDRRYQSLTYSPCLNAGDSWIQTILAY